MSSKIERILAWSHREGTCPEIHVDSEFVRYGSSHTESGKERDAGYYRHRLRVYGPGLDLVELSLPDDVDPDVAQRWIANACSRGRTAETTTRERLTMECEFQPPGREYSDRCVGALWLENGPTGRRVVYRWRRPASVSPTPRAEVVGRSCLMSSKAVPGHVSIRIPCVGFVGRFSAEEIAPALAALGV